MKKIISLFTGAGGMDIGFHRNGFEPIICVDNDPESCKTIRMNSDWPIFEGDVRTFDYVGNVDGVIGGPPCQGFSSAGKGNPDDPRNFLWREYFRVVASTKPSFVVLENVTGMLHQKNRHQLASLIAQLEGLGFIVSYGVLNAADFGVPQNRRRLFVLAGRGFPIQLPTPLNSRPKTVREALWDLEAPSATVKNHMPNNHAAHVIERWSRLMPGEVDPNYRRARLDPDVPSTTIRAGGGFGPKGDHLAGFHPPIHYSLPRQLTVREAARLQGFPDYWIFGGSKTAQGRQVGNAVAPPVAEAVARSVLDAIVNHEKQVAGARVIKVKEPAKRYAAQKQI
jgi:DNA (cytosine-5)-methyltransferase 1